MIHVCDCGRDKPYVSAAEDIKHFWPAIQQWIGGQEVRIIRPDSIWTPSNLALLYCSRHPKEAILRVFYPISSASPKVTRGYGAPPGGTEFLVISGTRPHSGMSLSYQLRFSDNFDFCKGGKLPGLFGGRRWSGGNIPNGTDGFSTRYMWRTGGQGELYLYIPGLVDSGLSVSAPGWTFERGRWHTLEQRVDMNTPNLQDGRVRVWLDKKLLLERDDIRFRTTQHLGIEGIAFSTFFGGGDPSWASRVDAHIDFCQINISA